MSSESTPVRIRDLKPGVVFSDKDNVRYVLTQFIRVGGDRVAVAIGTGEAVSFSSDLNVTVESSS